MREYLQSFFEEFDYPREAANVLTAAYDTIRAERNALKCFDENLAAFSAGRFADNKDELKLLDEVSEMSGVHRYTVHLLFYICLSKFTRTLYEQRGLSHKIFFDSMSDLKWKLYECHTVYGVWGSFVASWFKEFFMLERFALGRLQFELKPFKADSYSKNGFALIKGDLVINMHIPSSGPLYPEACRASYAEAAEFFKDAFVERPVAFVCNSWLLFPLHREFLPAESNILKFMDGFDIVSSATDDNYGDLWRIFNKPVTLPIDAYIKNVPRDTSLRRAYADWVAAGNAVGSGYGILTEVNYK